MRRHKPFTTNTSYLRLRDHAEPLRSCVPQDPGSSVRQITEAIGSNKISSAVIFGFNRSAVFRLFRTSDDRMGQILCCVLRLLHACVESRITYMLNFAALEVKSLSLYYKEHITVAVGVRAIHINFVLSFVDNH
jgi:hypothetical protein